MLCFTRNLFVVTALWAGALSWCRIRLLERHFSGRCLRTASRRHCRTFVEFLIYRLSSRDVLMMNQPVSVEEPNQNDLDIGLHLPRLLRSRRWCHVLLGGHLLCFQVIPVKPAFVTSDYPGHEVGIVLGSLMEVSANWNVIILLLHRQETEHKCSCHTSHLQIFSQNFLACTECYSNLLCNLSDRCRSAWMISRICATVSSVWGVDGLPGQGSSSNHRRPLLKWDYHSNVLGWLRQDSPKAACSISYVSALVFPRRKKKLMYTRCCTLPSIVRCDAHLQVDVHWKASTEQTRRDTDLRFCTYTCTELTHVPLCCHFATY